MKNKLAVLLLPFLLRSSVFAYDPYHEDQTRQQATQDPDKYTRPTTNELKGPEIKEFRDKLNAAKTEIFKDGSVPGGAKFQAQTQDVAGNKFHAQAPLATYSQSVQKQILSKMPDAKAGSLVQVDVTVDGKVATVDSAKFAETKSDAQTLVTPKAATPASPAVPATARAATPPTNGKTPTSSQQIQSNEPKAVPASEKPAPISEVAKRISADSAVTVRPAEKSAGSSAASNDNIITAAVIPNAGGPALLVTPAKESQPGAVTVEVRGPSSALPVAIKNQIKTDQPQAVSALAQKGDVSVVVAIHSDKTFSVVSVQSIPETKNSPNGNNSPAAPTAEPTVTTPSETPGEPTSAVVPTKADIGKSQPSIVLAAQSLATLIGADPKTVTAQKPTEVVTKIAPAAPPVADNAKAVIVALQNGGEISVRQISAGTDSTAPVYQATSKFADLSPELKTEVFGRLADFGAKEVLKGNAEVEIQFTAPSDGKINVTQISIKDPARSTASTVVLWKANPSAAIGSPVANTPTQPSPVGLVPAAAALLQNVFNLKAGGFVMTEAGRNMRAEVRTADGQTGKDISFTWNADAPPGPYDFSAIGKPLDFSDEIREAVYTKLREAVQNGDTWAADALNGKKDLQVEFTVAELADGTKKVQVASVSLEPADAAAELAGAMGLKEGDFSVVNALDQTLVVLERGKTGLVKLGDKSFKLKSPDGDAKVFVRQNRAKKDASAVLLLSPKALEANRFVLGRLIGGDSNQKIVQALRDNPNAEQFLVSINLNDEDKIILKPAAPPEKHPQ